MNDGKIDNVRIIVAAANADEAERLIASYANKHMRASHVTVDIQIQPSISPEFSAALQKRIDRLRALSEVKSETGE